MSAIREGSSPTPPSGAPEPAPSDVGRSLSRLVEFETLYRAAPVGLAVFDRELRYVQINEWLARINGASVEAHIGRTVREMVPALADQIDLVVRRILETGEPWRDIEVVGTTSATGESVHTWLEQWHPVRDGRGEIAGFSIVVEDVTARKAAEAALRRSEARLNAMVTATAEVTYRMNADWSQMLECHGAGFVRSADAPSGLWLTDYVPPEERASVMAAIRRAVDAGAVFELEHRVIRADGTLGWTLSRAVPLFDEHGGIVEWFGAASDVTVRRQNEEALREADRAKDEFLAMLAHELRNPLAPIVNAHRLLERDGTLSARGRDALSMAQRHTGHMRRLVDDLLEVSRVTRGKIEIRPEPVDVATAIRHAVDSLAPESEARRHRVGVRLPPEPIRLLADPTRLAQILENLLHNACKYTPDGGEIRIEAARDGVEVAIRITDDGIGIDPAKQSRLFELFHQVDPTLNRSHGGLGIGLALVRRLVELHAGSVSVHSLGLGAGSTFTVRLPVDRSGAG